MKNFILITLLLISGLILILEPKTITAGIIIAKIISLMYAGIFFKANNYFCKGDE